MIRHAESHVDHGLTEAQIRYLLDRFADRESFFIETITLPRELGAVPCALYGPLMGDSPIREDEVHYAKRGTRAWRSRLMIGLPPREQHEVSVIGGPHDGRACILYTAFGGPIAPQEPGDVRRQLEAVEKLRRERKLAQLPDPSGGVADEVERARLDPEIYGKIVELRKKRSESDAFWREHALAQ